LTIAPPKRMRHHIIKTGKLLLTLLLCWLVYIQIDPKELPARIASINPFYLSAAFVALHGITWLQAAKWRALLPINATLPPFLWFVRLTYESYVLNLVLPTNVGGDLYRAHQLSRLQVSRSDSYGSVILGRLFGLFSILLLISLSLPFTEGMKLPSGLPLLVGGLTITLAGALLLAGFHPQKVLLVLHRWIPARITPKKAPTPLTKTQFVRILVASAAVQGGIILTNGLLLLGLGMELTLINFISVTCVLILATQVPITVFGIGLREASTVYLYDHFMGIPPEASLALNFFAYLINMTQVLIGYILFIQNKKQVSTNGQDFA
jgi:glycosyltransferase 2 family protein